MIATSYFVEKDDIKSASQSEGPSADKPIYLRFSENYLFFATYQIDSPDSFQKKYM